MNRFLTATALAASAFAATIAIAQTPPQTPPAPAAGMPRHMGGGMGMRRLDLNGDGVITRAEATAAADARFDRLDTDRDGKLTVAELEAGRPARGGVADDTPPHMGKARDPNRDGMLTRDEFRNHALAQFDRMDANRDGKVDQAEMAAFRQTMQERRAQRGQRGAAPMAPAGNQ